MKATALKEKLKEGLDITERIAVKSASLPILGNVLLSVEKQIFCLSATDLQVGVTYRFLGTTDEEGQAVFPGKLLSPLLAVFTEEHVAIEKNDAQMVVASGSHKAIIKTLDEEEFPIIPTLKGDELFVNIATESLCKGINQVVGMTGQSQARPEISGILFVFEKKVLKLVATDSFRLAEKTILLERGGFEGSFILPAKTARELVAIFGERSGRAAVYISSTQVVFDYIADGDPSQLHIQVVSRTIEGEYPQYEDVLPSAQKTTVEVNRSDFLNHVRAASIFAGKTNEVRLTADPAKKTLGFFAQNAEAGEDRSVLNGNVSGEKVEVAFNWRFLAEGLSQLKASQVEIGMNGEDGPALLKSTEQEGYRYVLMPIKA